jgi:hypothetical protein
MGLLPLLQEKLDTLEMATEENSTIEKSLEEVKNIISQAVSEAEIFLKSL